MNLDNKKWMNVGQVAQLIGSSERHIYTLVSQKGVPFYRFGGKIRFDRDEIEQWVKECKQQPQHLAA